MIVIATNNGKDFIWNLLDSMGKFGTDGYSVIVVDTGSTDIEFKESLEDRARYYHFVRDVCFIDGGRDTAAYIHAFSNYPSAKYMFMHDSMKVKDSLWLRRFFNKFSSYEGENPLGIVAHSVIDIANDQWPPCDSIKQKLPFNPNTISYAYGVFGPIFATTDTFMQACRDSGCFSMIPANRDEAQGVERLWGAVASYLGFDVTSVYGYYDYHAILRDDFDGLSKFLPIRP